LKDAKKHLHGRLLLEKGDAPVTARELYKKLSSLWREIGAWKQISLKKGFCEFQFPSIEDMRKIWAIGTFNLKPGVLRLIKWLADFCPHTQKQTCEQVWILLMDLPQEY
jgi:hypothetical protein